MCSTMFSLFVSLTILLFSFPSFVKFASVLHSSFPRQFFPSCVEIPTPLFCLASIPFLSFLFSAYFLSFKSESQIFYFFLLTPAELVVYLQVLWMLRGPQKGRCAQE